MRSHKCKPRVKLTDRDAKRAYHEARQPKPGRPGVSSLILPGKHYRPGIQQSDFETKSFCMQEDELRSRLLAKTAHQGVLG